MSFEKLCKLVNEFEKRSSENTVSVSEALQNTMIEVNKIRDFAMMLADESSNSTEEEVTRLSLSIMANRIASMLHDVLAKLNNIQYLAKHEVAKERKAYEHLLKK